MPHGLFALPTSFPKAIIHVDADSFFASVEQTVHPEYKGKPLITGQERGIASAVSIEAKQLGIKRGMSIKEIKLRCPEIIYVPSDYETYSLFSRRMFEIIRRYTNQVEEYSIDEFFADISGLRRYQRASYQEIAGRIKHDIESDLGLTVSLGLAPTKVLAKIGSNWNKPSGLVTIAGSNIDNFLKTVPARSVWGIGPQTTNYLKQYGIETAFDFAKQTEQWVTDNVTKPHQEIWRELRGQSVLLVTEERKSDYKSISKTKTFTPPSTDRQFILSQLSKNIENACIKARRYNLVAHRIYFMLRTQDFRHRGCEIKLTQPTNSPNVMYQLAEQYFDRVWQPKEEYRLTGVVLGSLSEPYEQQDLFGESIQIDRYREVFTCLDVIDQRYGKHTVHLGSSFTALKNKQHTNDRATHADRKTNLFRGENFRQRLSVPLIGEVT